MKVNGNTRGQSPQEGDRIMRRVNGTFENDEVRLHSPPVRRTDVLDKATLNAARHFPQRGDL